MRPRSAIEVYLARDLFHGQGQLDRSHRQLQAEDRLTDLQRSDDGPLLQLGIGVVFRMAIACEADICGIGVALGPRPCVLVEQYEILFRPSEHDEAMAFGLTEVGGLPRCKLGCIVQAKIGLLRRLKW